MVNAYRQFVTIQKGGRVEITSDQLPVGQRAEVIVLVSPEAPGKSYLALFGSGRGTFTSVEAADAFIRRERDSWEN